MMQNNQNIKLLIERELCILIKNAENNSSILKEITFLSGVYDLLKNNKIKTKRGFYYSNVNVFKSQNSVNTLIKKYTKKFNCKIEDLNLEAGIKGIYKGKVYFTEEDEHVNKTNKITVQLIPRINKCKVCCEVRSVVIVEKESVFNRLHNEEILFICGKGFPDKNTLKFIELLPKEMQIYCLVDFDPHGLHIYKIYNKTVNCKRIITQRLFFKYKISKDQCIQLSDLDVKMLKKMILNEETKDDACFLLGFGYKIEIEAFLNSAKFVSSDFLID